MEATLERNNNVVLVRDIMTDEVITVTLNNPMSYAKFIMKDKSISGLPVIDKNMYLLGIVSVADIIKAMEKNEINEKVSKYMTSNVVSVGWNATVGQALKAFRKYKFGRFPVVNEKGQVVGIITPSDVVIRLAQYLSIDALEEYSNKELDPTQQQEMNFEPRVMVYEINNEDMDHTGEGASELKKLLLEMDISRDIVRRCAIVAYEAEMNVMIHAYEGKMTASISAQEVSIIVEDKGPGIEDLSKAMRKGYSTASEQARKMGFGAGMGLPNIKKYADEFFIESSPNGTRLIAKIYVNK